jgi:hypothetical protein
MGERWREPQSCVQEKTQDDTCVADSEFILSTAAQVVIFQEGVAQGCATTVLLWSEYTNKRFRQLEKIKNTQKNNF